MKAKFLFKFLIIIILCLGRMTASFAQKGGVIASDSTRMGDSLGKLGVQTDSIIVPKKKFRLRRSEFNVVITRTLLAAGAMSDSVPVAGTTSGSFAFGLGYNFNLNKKLALNIQPQFNLYRVRYKEKSAQDFPIFADTSVAISSKRHLLNYIEMPVGIVYTFKRDEKTSRVTYIEGGVFGGFNVFSGYKVKYTINNDLFSGSSVSQILKSNDVPYAFPLRYGLYARLGKGFLSLQVNYRLSNLFTTNRRFYSDPSNLTLVKNPKLSGLEIGFSIVL